MNPGLEMFDTNVSALVENWLEILFKIIVYIKYYSHKMYAYKIQIKLWDFVSKSMSTHICISL